MRLDTQKSNRRRIMFDTFRTESRGLFTVEKEGITPNNNLFNLRKKQASSLRKVRRFKCRKTLSECVQTMTALP